MSGGGALIQRTASQSACVEAQSPELLTAVFGMFLRQPFDEKVKPSFAALRADASAPARPVLDQPREADQPDDLLIRCVFDQAARGPILVQPPKGATTFQDFEELSLIEVVIPDIRRTLICWHGIDYTPTLNPHFTELVLSSLFPPLEQ